MIIASLCGLVERVTTSQDEILDVRKAGIHRLFTEFLNGSDNLNIQSKEDPWNNKEMLLYFFVTMMIFFCAADMGKNDYMNSDRKKIFRYDILIIFIRLWNVL